MKNSNSNYPCNGALRWDIDSIKTEVSKLSRSKNLLPNFGLERVEIHPTSLCQYNCPFCYGINLKNKTKINLPLKEIEKNILKSIRGDKKLSKHNPIIILGGLYSEPLLYKEKIKLIELLGKYNFRFGIYTNGEALNEEVMGAICKSAKRINNKKPSYISFNISSVLIEKRYDFLMEKIKKLIKLRDKMKAPVEVNASVLVYNNYLLENDARKIQAEMLKIGVDRIRYSVPQTPVSYKNFINTENNGLVRSLQAAGGDSVYVKLISGERFNRCYVMANMVSIDHKGDVYPCSQVCSSHFKGFSYGSIKNRRLAEIWGGEKHKKLFYNFNQTPARCRCNTTDYQFNLLCSLIEQEII